ncbi:MAG: prepilin peptidase [Acidobacteria bacterium]|jgi:leader peptidase (prepilin peptidase)/N-methyltransferase|nr:prepilin peptidase [Acidobacteriota bacterium]
MGDFEQPFVMAFAFAFGAVVGSFLNVIIYRLPREISIVRTPPSSCPACSTPIRWYDNIPLISWVLLRGRCRECKAPISFRYPLVELVSGLLAVAAVARWGLSVTGFEVVIFAWVSVTLGLIDLDFQILPDVLTYPSIVFGLVCSLLGGYTWWLDSLAGATVGALLPILVIVIYKLLRGIEGMGWGDVKYLAAIGSVVGLHGVVGVLVVASITGALVGLGMIVVGRGSGKTALPFGTFLALAVILWLYAPAAWLSYSPW